MNSSKSKTNFTYVQPLSVMEHTSYDGDVACDGWSVSQEKPSKMAFTEEKICYKMVWYSLYSREANRIWKLEFTQTKNKLFWKEHLKVNLSTYYIIFIFFNEISFKSSEERNKHSKVTL